MSIPSISKTEAFILTALSSGERYGLEMVRKVEDISEGKVKLSIGGLYTTLHRMEEKGLVISRWGEPTEIRKGARRKYYKITGVGMQRWREATTAFKALIEYGLNPTCAGVI